MQPVPVVQQGLVNTGRGLDFSSVIRSNPQMSQQAQYFTQHVQQPQEHVPSWARPVMQYNTGGYPQQGYPQNGYPPRY